MKFTKSIVATAIAVSVTIFTVATKDGQKIDSDNEPPSIQNEITINKQNLSHIIVGDYSIAPVRKFTFPDPVKPAEQPLQSEHNSVAERTDTIARDDSPAKRYDDSVEIIGEDTAYRDEKGKSNCATYATKFTGINKRLGYGITVQPEGTEPKIGAIVIFRNYHHAGALVGITEDNKFIVNDTNWIVGKITQHILTANEIKGYIY